jgi:DmsE family decaheme c-type cytochrome
MRVTVPVLLLACIFAGAVTLVPAQGEYDSADCAMCHEDVVAAFQRTGHAIAPGWDASTGCQACHGPGEAHIDGGGDLDAIIRPQMLSPRESSDNCLSCHEGHEKHFSARRAIHRLNDVGCISCHNPHSPTEKMLAKEGVELCAQCHQSVAAEFELPRHHPLDERPFDVGGPPCASCHEPHATRSNRSSSTPSRTVCGNCHFEKVGPFVYSHDVTLVDGCAACHMAHGSTNRHLLRHESQINLCYECHGANQTPGWHSAPAYANQKCTSCHTAIHGSNTSPLFLEN